MIELTTGVAFLLSSMYGTGSAAAVTATPLVSPSPAVQASPAIAIATDRKEVEKYLRTEYADTPILVDIARCESTFAQFDQNGKVVRGKANPLDVGVMQINEKFHASTAKALGYDLYTIKGNVGYAKHLYKEQGAAPWSASAKCWSQS